MLTSLKIKKHIRSANKTARWINNIILNDDLWRGRFYMRQKSVQWEQYCDKSGLNVLYCYEFIDLKTGFTKDYWFDGLTMDYNGPFRGNVGWTMNKFIVEDCQVWEKEGREQLYYNKTLWRKKNEDLIAFIKRIKNKNLNVEHDNLTNQ